MNRSDEGLTLQTSAIVLCHGVWSVSPPSEDWVNDQIIMNRSDEGLTLQTSAIVLCHGVSLPWPTFSCQLSVLPHTPEQYTCGSLRRRLQIISHLLHVCDRLLACCEYDANEKTWKKDKTILTISIRTPKGTVRDQHILESSSERGSAYMLTSFNPFNPKSDQFHISPAASPEILHHAVWRTWLFIAYTQTKNDYTTNSHHRTYTSLFKGLGECTHQKPRYPTCWWPAGPLEAEWGLYWRNSRPREAWCTKANCETKKYYECPRLPNHWWRKRSHICMQTQGAIRYHHAWTSVFKFNRFTPKSGQCQISPVQPHKEYYITQYEVVEELGFSYCFPHRWKDYQTVNSHYPAYTFLFKRLGECTFWTWEWKG